MQDPMPARKLPENQNLFAVSFVESGMNRMYKAVPREYIYRMLAEKFLEAIVEKMEISSQKDWNDPYAVRHLAQVFIAKPSDVFQYNRLGNEDEVVVLDYKGFTRRVVTNRRWCDVEVMDIPPLCTFSELGKLDPNKPIKCEKLKFTYRGQVNALGERVFEWEPPPRNKKDKE